MNAPGIHLSRNYIRERLRSPSALRLKGYRFRTKKSGRHLLIIAARGPKRGRRGETVVQAILHPLSELTGPGRKFVCRNKVCRRLVR